MLVALRVPYQPAFVRRSSPRQRRESFVTVGADAQPSDMTKPGDTKGMLNVPTAQTLGVAAVLGTTVAILAFVGTLWTAHPLIGALGMGAIGGVGIVTFVCTSRPVNK